MKRKDKGILLGIWGTCCYGTNPLFALPLFAAGITSNSVLFYRYGFALIIFGEGTGHLLKYFLNLFKTAAQKNFVENLFARSRSFDAAGCGFCNFFAYLVSELYLYRCRHCLNNFVYISDYGGTDDGDVFP